MSLQVEKLEHNMAKLTIEAPAEDLEKALEKAYQKNKKDISVPGFRKGKVPRAMVEKMYGAGVFYEDAANALIPEAYADAVEGCKDIEVVSQPEIEVVQLEKGQPFIFTAVVALKPEVELGKYKGVEIDKIDTEVTDADVDAKIAEEQEANASTSTVEGRPVQDKDITIIDFEGFVDDVAFEGGKGENYSLTIGSGAFIPGFEEQLIGAEVDKEVEVKVTFPEEYHADNLAGKDAVFKVTVKEIKEKKLPEIDDEFASEVSEFDTLAEYKEDVKANLQDKKNEEAKSKKEEAVIDAIIEDAKMDIPDAMVNTQTRQMINDYAQRLQMQGLSLEQYFMFTGLDMEKFEAQMKPGAEKRIQSRLVLEAVAKAEDIQVSDEDYEAEIAKMAEQYQMEADKLKDMIGDYEKEQITEDLKVQKAVELVISSAVEK